MCGVGGISGLRILDMISNKQYEFDQQFAKFTIDFSEEKKQQDESTTDLLIWNCQRKTTFANLTQFSLSTLLKTYDQTLRFA